MDVCAGIDIGGTNTAFGLVDAAGNVHFEGRLETATWAAVEDYVDALAGEVRAAVATGGVTLRGIGVGAPNANERDGTIAHAPNLPWKGAIPLAAMIAERFAGCPVRVANDANAAAVGELVYGGARRLRDFVMVTLGTGVGGGFVANGELVRGHDGLAGELGHVVVDWDGRPCGCGRRGCLETYASVPGFVETARALLAAGEEPSVLRDIEPLTGRDVTAAARAGDAIAFATFERTGRVLGRALANVVALTGPERIFVFGGLAQAGELLLEPTQRHLDRNVLDVLAHETRLELSQLLDRNAGILGAAALAWRRLAAAD